MPSGPSQPRTQPRPHARGNDALRRPPAGLALLRSRRKGLAGVADSIRTLFAMVTQNYRVSQITRMAAALSFRTIFGLIPILVVGLVTLYRFIDENQVKKLITQLLDFTGISAIVVEEKAEVAASVPGLNIFGGAFMTPEAAQETVTQAQRLDDWIRAIVERINTINFGAIGLVSIVILLYAAISMVVEIEKAFNQIAMAPTGKSWIKRITHYWALLTLGPLLLVLSFTVAQSAQPMIEGLVKSNLGLGGQLFSDAIGSLLAIPISLLTLVIVFTSVPNTRVHIRAAFWGALLAAFAWEVSKWGLLAYVKYSAGYARLYGVIALIPLFLLWIYVTWIIVLVGFHVTVILQTFRDVPRERLPESLMRALGLVAPSENEPTPGLPGVKLADASAGLQVICAVADRFDEGKTSDHSSIAAATHVDEVVIAHLMERFAGENLLLRVSSGDQEQTYTLARPPASIDAEEVLMMGDDAFLSSHPTPIADAVREAHRRVFRGKTIADVQAFVRGPAPANAPASPAPPPAPAPPSAPAPPAGQVAPVPRDPQSSSPATA